MTTGRFGIPDRTYTLSLENDSCFQFVSFIKQFCEQQDSKIKNLTFHRKLSNFYRYQIRPSGGTDLNKNLSIVTHDSDRFKKD